MTALHTIISLVLPLWPCADKISLAAIPLDKVANQVATMAAPAEPAEPIVTEHGIASWYSIKTNYGTQTASGRQLSNHAYTAAHKKWPMGSKVRVTNLRNGRSEILTISDRGPYIKGRIIDVTVGSAKRLGFYDDGLAKTKVELLERGNWKYQH